MRVGVEMDKRLYTIDAHDLYSITDLIREQAINSIESGKIIYFPSFSFTVEPHESHLLSSSLLNPKEKNISYDYQSQHLAGLTLSCSDTITTQMQALMHRFAEFTKDVLDKTLPQYSESLRWGRTSYRPAEIKNRKMSKRKDDTRLHVDSFSASPVYGWRIFRIFCNINPHGEPRVWHLGEPFSHLLPKFAPQIPTYSLWRSKVLKFVKTTKTLRSPYDHYMIHLHDKMKSNNEYQRTVNKDRIEFPSNSTWLVFTDHVSHAALSGQFVLEQTFYLPIAAMKNSEFSPLKQWEKEKSIALI